ncbi:hypothetical protein HMI56_000040 [Coelomomyces lativittatus]|nr:hypothetical protein HMI56_000040 [Coelomomyces lativittatus]
MLANTGTDTLEEFSDNEEFNPNFISRELMEKEEQYRKLDRELQTKTTLTLAETQHVVNESLGFLHRPNFLSSVSAETLIDSEPLDATPLNNVPPSSSQKSSAVSTVVRKPHSAPTSRRKASGSESSSSKKHELSASEVNLISKITEKLQEVAEDSEHDYTLGTFFD